MSRALCCDNCGATLVVDARGEDIDGETAGWLKLTLGGVATVDLCTRACVHAYLDNPEIIAAYNANQEIIADIARSIRDGDDGVRDE